MNKLNIGLLGLGTVGSGVPMLIEEHRKKLLNVTGTDIRVKTAFVRTIETKKEIANQYGFDLTTDVADIFNDDEIDVVVEVIGGVTDAKEFISKALKKGKHVVTANKDLIAQHGLELVNLAKENNCLLYYEAAVAGGIPILRTISNSMVADEITSIYGIVNGTTNYMLSQMVNKNWSYEKALEEAQRLGFAESDPTNDVEGIDAAYKMVILTQFSFGMSIVPEQVITKGISGVTLQDIETAASLGYVIKLLGSSEKVEDGVHVEVGPVLVPKKHPLSTVENEMNAVFIKSFGVGESMYYGPGAGSNPTATSVISDLTTIAKNVQLGVTSLQFNSFEDHTEFSSDDKVVGKHYFSINVPDEPGVFKKLAEIMLEENVSLEQIKQESEGNQTSRIVLITHETNLRDVLAIEERLKQEPEFTLLSRFRVL